MGETLANISENSLLSYNISKKMVFKKAVPILDKNI